ncbi:MAG: alpha-L-fucosidase [Muribaculaceae bacterium]
MRLRTFLLFVLATILVCGAKGKNHILPVPSHTANKAQLKQIERRYGMFIHFGINTFHDQEWTDGSKPAMSYAPTAIDADQWIKSAKDAGMKYVILITKHHDGFCLWDSRYTDYDVASSANQTNVVEAVAKACKKYGIGLGLYYSLWDRKENADVKNQADDAKYNQYMLAQLKELLEMTKKITPVVEFWFDGGWVKQAYRWPTLDIYTIIKSYQPDCQVGINWTIGMPDNADTQSVTPEKQQAGYPIRYFPSDFRLGDPYLPTDDDPKIFTYSGQDYYMPWESTVCISGRWFYNTTDNNFKSIDELEKLYRRCTKNDNILILNCPPNREGRLRDRDVEILLQLRDRLQLK